MALPKPFDSGPFLDGAVAIVTGGSSGIGEATAQGLAAAGARVGVVASHGLEKAKAVADAIVKSGGVAAPFVADVRDEAAVAALVKGVEQKFGPTDILLNAAGVFFPTPAGETARADADRLIDINIKGTWACINAVAPGMKQRKRGRIVNIASAAGVIGVGSFALYCASKAAIIMMTKTLARELAPHGVNINAVAPGNTATPMNAPVRQDTSEGSMYDAMRRITPSTTVFSAPEDIAAAILYLVSPAARPMHGATLVIDEGISTGV